MTDLEDRLSSALGGAAASAPDATGLAGAARGRATARRRRTTLVSAAASVAVLAVVGGVVALGSRGGGGGTPVAGNDTTSPATGAAVATRVETWRDVSVDVPAGSGHGPLPTWCTEGSEPGTPRVERPGGVVESIACSPTNGYGVQFSRDAKAFAAYSPGAVSQYTGDEYPQGAWVGYQVTDTGNVVQVVAPTQGEAGAVLASFAQVQGVDANGCAPKPQAEPYGAAADTVRLCRYGPDGWLEQSETLTGEDARKAVRALDAAPSRPALMCPNLADAGYVLVQSADHTAEVRWGGCTGVFGWGLPQADVTADVLYWVLSPGWSGQLPDGITMAHLRQ